MNQKISPDVFLLLLVPCLTLKLLEPALQLVVVEGSLAREPGAGPPNGAGGVRRAGVVQGRGEGPGEAGGGALELHAETPVGGLDEASPQTASGRNSAEKYRSFQTNGAVLE